MGELGENENYYHQEVGNYINNHKFLDKNTIVITVGNLSKNITEQINNCKSLNFENIELAVKYIEEGYAIAKEITYLEPFFLTLYILKTEKSDDVGMRCGDLPRGRNRMHYVCLGIGLH